MDSPLPGAHDKVAGPGRGFLMDDSLAHTQLARTNHKSDLLGVGRRGAFSPRDVS